MASRITRLKSATSQVILFVCVFVVIVFVWLCCGAFVVFNQQKCENDCEWLECSCILITRYRVFQKGGAKL